MAQDIIADGLNQIMNAKVVQKPEVTLKRYSKLLLNLFAMMKAKEHIDYDIDEVNKTVTVKILKLNKCRAVKPRYPTGYDNIETYLRRFLPSRNFGTLVLSTNKGLMSHQEAIANKIGGSVIAYFY